MSALDFPTSPSDGDTYEGYVYNAAKGVWQWQTLTPSLVSLTDTTISSPSSGEVLEYDGTNWVNAAGGGLVAVKSALKTDRHVESGLGASEDFAIPGLSITHEVSDPANKLIISAFIGVAASSLGRGNVGIAISDGTELIALADAAGARTRVTAGGQVASTSSGLTVTMPSVTFVHTPGAGSKTYTVHAIQASANTSETIHINSTQDNTDNANRARGVSSLVIQEVAV